MHLSDPLSFAGNLIAVFGLGWKTSYDLWWNTRRFKREITEIGVLEAARQKRERADNSSLTLFIVLLVSYLVFIIGDFKK
jgi:hypothetical protein